ncbi:hypothetical protein HZ326_18796 [Fusarium oxysporum f. sp. albedinis]|nr:hypothetical protein HZ326_18796 [Fusarium oxysporum f. sp. albedinis]
MCWTLSIINHTTFKYSGQFQQNGLASNMFCQQQFNGQVRPRIQGLCCGTFHSYGHHMSATSACITQYTQELKGQNLWLEPFKPSPTHTHTQVYYAR